MIGSMCQQALPVEEANLQPHPCAIAEQEEQLNAICAWIEAQCQLPITWVDLCNISGLSHQQLVRLFMIHKKTTPMAYMRQCQKKLASAK